MQLRPVKTHILCRFYNPPERVIETPSKVFDGHSSRTRVEVLAIGPMVNEKSTVCEVGDFLYLIPKPSILPVDGDDGLIDSAAVLGVVEDDKRPLEIVG